MPPEAGRERLAGRAPGGAQAAGELVTIIQVDQERPTKPVTCSDGNLFLH